MAALQAVCFDLDSTLCLNEQSDREIYEATFERVDVERFFDLSDLRAIDGAELPTADTELEFYENLMRAVAEEVGADPSHAPALAEATVEVVDATAVEFREGAREAVDYARERYDVGLITNGGEAGQTAKLETLGVADAFDGAVFCDPADGIDPKPDPTPFEIALDELGAAPEETLYVGDSLAADVRGAHEFGLQTAWVPVDREHEDLPESPDPEPTYRLDSPADLLEIL